MQPSDQQHIAQIRPFLKELELIPFEGYNEPGRWKNRLAGWRKLLFNKLPKYVQTFPVSEMREPLRRLIKTKSFDVVAIDQLYLVQLKTELTGIPAVLVEHNVESAALARRYQTASNPLHKVRDWINWKRLKEFERYWLQQFRVCVAVSSDDAVRTSQLAPSALVLIVPNGVDCSHFKNEGSQRNENKVLFFGTLNYGPNIDALEWFCCDIWPSILSRLPDAELEIVGIDPTPRVISLSNEPGVFLTAFVPDIRPKLWLSTVTVVPIRIGGGTRLKILEAMAAGCPVVSTSFGAEGLDVENGKHLHLADSQRDFAEKVIGMLMRSDESAMMAHAARELVEEQYDWQVISARFEYALEKTIEMHGSTATKKP